MVPGSLSNGDLSLAVPQFINYRAPVSILSLSYIQLFQCSDENSLDMYFMSAFKHSNVDVLV